MAKKVRRKLEEDDEPAFDFPTFDEPAFIGKELELNSATVLAAFFALALGLISWGMTTAGLPWFSPLLVGVGGLIGSGYVIRSLRPASPKYTRGDWAGIFALEFFGWFALWFVLLDLVGH